MQQYKVSELTEQIRKLFEGAFSGLISVTGEVGEFSRSSGGHCYFSLKDEGAKIKAVFFKTNIRSDSFIPKNGDKVSCIAELRTYSPDGSYQLIVRKVEYNAEGEYWKKFEETKRILLSEGLLNEEKKRPLMLYPRRVCLLTAEGGAAVKDFITTAQNTGGRFIIDLWPIPVQGTQLIDQIVQTIKQAGSRKDLYDVLVLTRGGGSLDDLSVFNEEAVARALCTSEVPTLSAIGHEQDVTIADFAADQRASTPTAAAELLSRNYPKAELRLDNFSSRIFTLLRFRQENANLNFDRLNTRLNAVGPGARIEGYSSCLSLASGRLIKGLESYLNVAGTRVKDATAGLYGPPVSRLTQSAHKAELAAAGLLPALRKRLDFEAHRVELVTQQLHMTDPERLLTMGYALVLKNKHVVTSISDVSLEDSLEIRLQDGRLDSFVTGKKTKT